MGIKFGEIDILQVVDNEYRSKVLEKLIKLILEKNSLHPPTSEEMQEIRNQVIRELQEKYPSSGVKLI